MGAREAIGCGNPSSPPRSDRLEHDVYIKYFHYLLGPNIASCEAGNLNLATDLKQYLTPAKRKFETIAS